MCFQIGQVIPITFYLVITRATMIRMGSNSETRLSVSELQCAGRSVWTHSSQVPARSIPTFKPVEVHIDHFVVQNIHDASTGQRPSKELDDNVNAV